MGNFTCHLNTVLCLEFPLGIPAINKVAETLAKSNLPSASNNNFLMKNFNLLCFLLDSADLSSTKGCRTVRANNDSVFTFDATRTVILFILEDAIHFHFWVGFVN